MNRTQCRMARTALEWRAQDLANAAGLGYATVARFESGKDIAKDSLDAMRIAFESKGVQFSQKGDRISVSAFDMSLNGNDIVI